MRIISGSARGTQLAPLKGLTTRPTTDRIREALYSILISQRGDCKNDRVLDLFAGSGALAIEALSRGASAAVFVEIDRQAAETIRANLQRCRLQEKGELIIGNVLSTLPRLGVKGPFELIFLDPPYQQGLVSPTLELIVKHHLLTPEGMVIVETARKEHLETEIGPLRLCDQRNYGSTTLSFYSMNSEKSEA